MGVYDSQAGTALRLISSKGRRVTFTRPGGAGDPVTQQGRTAQSTYVAAAVAFPLSSARAAQMFGAGGADAIKRRLDVSIALKGVAVVPREGDRFIWGGAPMRIITVDAIDPNGSGNPIMARCVAEA